MLIPENGFVSRNSDSRSGGNFGFERRRTVESEGGLRVPHRRSLFTRRMSRKMG